MLILFARTRFHTSCGASSVASEAWAGLEGLYTPAGVLVKGKEAADWLMAGGLELLTDWLAAV